jgi:hypothetical protein
MFAVMVMTMLTNGVQVGYFNERKQGHFLTFFSAFWLYVTALFLPVRRSCSRY